MFPSRRICNMRAQILKDAIFMQETSPAKLPVPVHGKEFEFTLRSDMTVADFQTAVMTNAEVKDFKLTAADGKQDPSMKLSQLKQQQFRMQIDGK